MSHMIIVREENDVDDIVADTTEGREKDDVNV